MQKVGRTLDDLAGGMAQQIDGVLHTTCACKWAGIHSHAQILGQLLPVESLGLTGQLHGSLQQPSVNVGADEPPAKIDQHSAGSMDRVS